MMWNIPDQMWPYIFEINKARIEGRRINLQRAELQRAKLQWAKLQWAELQGADLRGAKLQGADLRGVKLDFSAFPLWCGSFGIIAGDRLVYQLIAHLTRLDVTHCSDDAKAAVAAALPWANKFCGFQDDVNEIETEVAG